MPTYLRWFNTLFILAVLVVAPVAYGTWQSGRTRNLHVVEEGVLYRSGQLSPGGFERVMHDHGIRTVICLRDGDKDDDKHEQAYCRKWGIKHVRIAAKAWWAPDGPPPAMRNVQRFREVMADPANHPVLIHCYAGLHRTGAFCAIHRMDFQGWSNEDAIAEMRRLGYHNIDDHPDLHTFLQRYQPRAEAEPIIRPASMQKP